MHTCEDLIREAWEGDDLAVLVAVLTLDGARQWVFYTRDVEECQERLHEMPHDGEPFPIELHAREDPGWMLLHEEILNPVLDPETILEMRDDAARLKSR